MTWDNIIEKYEYLTIKEQIVIEDIFNKELWPSFIEKINKAMNKLKIEMEKFVKIT